MKLVVVESPTKVKSISRFLSNEYTVISSSGHFHTLSNEKTYGIDIDNNFSPIFEVISSKKRIVINLKKYINKADELYIATDGDLEGEAIAYHIQSLVKKNYVKIYRVIFYEINKDEVVRAFNNTRNIDLNMVHAQYGRMILDKLFGYMISPILWRKIKNKLSAGRVQSVALRLVVEKEYERINFIKTKYLQLSINLEHLYSKEINIYSYKGLKVANSTSAFDDQGNPKDGYILLDTSAVEEISNTLNDKGVYVGDITVNRKHNSPDAPFTTVAIQQYCNAKYNFAPKYTMNLLQKLYEAGYISYHRTDSCIISDKAINEVRSLVQDKYGNKYLNPTVRRFKNKAIKTYGAHEAIRQSLPLIHDKDHELTGDLLKIYKTVCSRTIATQMSDSITDRYKIVLKSDDIEFHLMISDLIFDGYKKVLNSDEYLSRELIESLKLLKEDDHINVKKINVSESYTEPPKRYSEGKLVKKLNDYGIGRPSTYATIISTLLDRGYVYKSSNSLIPTLTSLSVVKLLMDHFDMMDYQFTSRLEDDLDKISDGNIQYYDWLKDLYYRTGGLQESVNHALECKFDRGVKLYNYLINVSKYPTSIGYIEKDGEILLLKNNIPLDELNDDSFISKKDVIRRFLFTDNEKDIYIFKGRYGLCLEIQKNNKREYKALPPIFSVENTDLLYDDISFEDIKFFLGLPKNLKDSNLEVYVLNYNANTLYVEYNNKRSYIDTKDNKYQSYTDKDFIDHYKDDSMNNKLHSVRFYKKK